MYQAWLDGDRDISQIPKEEDPFWEPVEDALIGTANIFLQSLGYMLDFEDCLSITDFKGKQEGTLTVHVKPCSEQGRPLGEEHYVEDPKELLDAPYHFKVSLFISTTI
jgi:kinesin family member 1